MILIADDEYFVTELIRRKFKEKNLACITANTIDAAKKALEEDADIKVVIIDFHFPESDGTELAKWMKDHYTKAIRIAVTAHSYEKYRDLEKEAVFHHIFQKPIDFETELFECVKQYV